MANVLLPSSKWTPGRRNIGEVALCTPSISKCTLDNNLKDSKHRLWSMKDCISWRVSKEIIHSEITWHEWEGTTKHATNPLKNLLEGACTGLGIGVQREGGRWRSSFSNLPNTCIQGVDVTMSYTDDTDDGAHAFTQGLPWVIHEWNYACTNVGHMGPLTFKYFCLRVRLQPYLWLKNYT